MFNNAERELFVKEDQVARSWVRARPIRIITSPSNCLVLIVLGLPIWTVQTQQPSGAVAANAKPPSFEVASIKPSKPDDHNHNWNDSADRVSFENYTLRRLIRVAFGLNSESQVQGGPKWIDNQAFDITAKIEDADVARLGKMNRVARNAERSLMLRSLLADRFNLKVSSGERELPVFALVIGKSGARLSPSLAQSGTQNDISGYNGHLTAVNISMDEFAHYITILDEIDNRVVLNRTDLTGRFDLKLDFSRDHGTGIQNNSQDSPELFTAIREQLGLELKPDKALVDVVVVESAREPDFD